MRLHAGEVEATGWRVERLSEVVRRLREASPGVSGRPRIVAVDGRGGAGKTTLVERLGRHVASSAEVHTDDVAWHLARFDWAGALVEHVLAPLHRGEAVRFRPPAWVERGRLGLIEVPAGVEVVWVEGTGVLRRELAPWLDASIWVQGDLEAQERRLAARDGDGPAQREHLAGWLAEELPFLLAEQPWATATLTVAGHHELDHDPQAEAVVGRPTAPEPPRRASGGDPASGPATVPRSAPPARPGADPGATSARPPRLYGS